MTMTMTPDVRSQLNRTVEHAVDVAASTAFALSSLFLTAAIWLSEKSQVFEARAELDDADVMFPQEHEG